MIDTTVDIHGDGIIVSHHMNEANDSGGSECVLLLQKT